MNTYKNNFFLKITDDQYKGQGRVLIRSLVLVKFVYQHTFQQISLVYGSMVFIFFFTDSVWATRFSLHIEFQV